MPGIKLDSVANNSVDNTVQTLIDRLPTLIGSLEIHAGCEVTSVGTGALPRYATVRINDYTVQVLWRGTPNINIGDEVAVIHYREGNRYEILTVSGTTGSSTPASMLGYVWVFDVSLGAFIYYDTINGALGYAALASGDYILIGPGTYDESITLVDGVSIVEMSPGTVTIHCTTANDAVTCVAGGYINIRDIKCTRPATADLSAINANIAGAGTCVVIAENIEAIGTGSAGAGIVYAVMQNWTSGTLNVYARQIAASGGRGGVIGAYCHDGTQLIDTVAVVCGASYSVTLSIAAYCDGGTQRTNGDLTGDDYGARCDGGTQVITYGRISGSVADIARIAGNLYTWMTEYDTVSGTITSYYPLADDGWIGLAGGAGARITFDDQVTDVINMADCDVGIGAASPQTKLDARDVDGASVVYVQGGTGAYTESAFYNAQGRSRFGYRAASTAVCIDDCDLSGTTTTKNVIIANAGSDRILITTAGNVGIGLTPSSRLDVSGDTETTGDFYPDGEGTRGLMSRLVNYNTAAGVTDHFRSGVIPTGFTWQGAPFSGTPGTLAYNYNGSWLRALINSASPYFLADAISVYSDKKIVAMMNAAYSTQVGIRIDDGTVSNSVDFYLDGGATGCCVPTFRVYTAGSPAYTYLCSMPMNQQICLHLQHFSSDGKIRGYLVGPNGMTIYAGCVSAAIGWTPARVGLTFNGTSSGYPSIDWFYSDFS